jgi:hypothetical protein
MEGGSLAAIDVQYHQFNQQPATDLHLSSACARVKLTCAVSGMPTPALPMIKASALCFHQKTS